MNTEIKNTILTTDKDAQYDESAKRLLGQKSILAHILVKTVDEFAGMDPKEVVSYIEGEPFINTVPIGNRFYYILLLKMMNLVWLVLILKTRNFMRE